jgi:hypothetical protein
VKILDREPVKDLVWGVFAIGVFLVLAKTHRLHPVYSVLTWIALPILATMLSRKAILDCVTLTGLCRVQAILLFLALALSFIMLFAYDPVRDAIGRQFVRGYAHWRAEPDWDEDGRKIQPEDEWTADTRTGHLGLELLVPFHRPTFRCLATESASPHQAPDMTGMITNTRQLLNQRGDTRQRPQGGLVALSCGTSQQCLGDTLRLRSSEFGFAARRALAGQPRLAGLFPRILPAISHLPGDTKTARYFRCGVTAAEKGGSLFSTLFHLGMVSGLRHAETIDRRFSRVTNKLSLYCASLNKIPPGNNSMPPINAHRPRINYYPR